MLLHSHTSVIALLISNFAHSFAHRHTCYNVFFLITSSMSQRAIEAYITGITDYRLPAVRNVENAHLGKQGERGIYFHELSQFTARKIASYVHCVLLICDCVPAHETTTDLKEIFLRKISKVQRRLVREK